MLPRPRPARALPLDDTVKVTCAPRRRSVAFFEREAAKQRVPYQRMIRALVDAYARRMGMSGATYGFDGGFPLRYDWCPPEGRIRAAIAGLVASSSGRVALELDHCRLLARSGDDRTCIRCVCQFSMLPPKALASLTGISGEMPEWPLSSSDRVLRLTPSAVAAVVIVRPAGSMHSSWINSTGIRRVVHQGCFQCLLARIGHTCSGHDGQLMAAKLISPQLYWMRVKVAPAIAGHHG